MTEREELLKKIRQQMVDHKIPFYEDIWLRLTLTEKHVLKEIAQSDWYEKVRRRINAHGPQ